MYCTSLRINRGLACVGAIAAAFLTPTAYASVNVEVIASSAPNGFGSPSVTGYYSECNECVAERPGERR